MSDFAAYEFNDDLALLVAFEERSAASIGDLLLAISGVRSFMVAAGTLGSYPFTQTFRTTRRGDLRFDLVERVATADQLSLLTVQKNSPLVMAFLIAPGPILAWLGVRVRFHQGAKLKGEAMSAQSKGRVDREQARYELDIAEIMGDISEARSRLLYEGAILSDGERRQLLEFIDDATRTLNEIRSLELVPASAVQLRRDQLLRGDSRLTGDDIERLLGPDSDG